MKYSQIIIHAVVTESGTVLCIRRDPEEAVKVAGQYTTDSDLVSVVEFCADDLIRE